MTPEQIKWCRDNNRLAYYPYSIPETDNINNTIRVWSDILTWTNTVPT